MAVAIAQISTEASGLSELTAAFTALLNNPFSVRWTAAAGKYVLLTLLLYPAGVAYYLADQQDRRPGEEHGSAKWGSPQELNQKYQNKQDKSGNQILTQHVQMGTDVYRHQRNLNTMVVGGSGAGKTRFFVKPNLMQCDGTNVILDPKGELLRDLGGMYEKKFIPVTVLDLVHFRGHYNPLAYVETDEDVIKLAYAIVNNTKPKDAPSGGDGKFWDDSSVMFISALLLYLVYEAPQDEQNLSTLMYMIQNCKMTEDSGVPNPMEILFQELEEREPLHPAVLQFNSFQLASTKTLQSVLITASANLYMFNSPQFAEMTNTDDMLLRDLGLHQHAVFLVIPDNNDTFNFLITMVYQQIFDLSFRLADSEPKYKGRVPVRIRLVMDEFANVAVPKNFEKIVAVCRSRNIVVCIILQSIAQLKALFKDTWEGIVGNCDSFLYLGGNEFGTMEYLSKVLGKWTQRTVSHSVGRGSHGSSSDSYQLSARELATPDEIRMMDRKDALLLISAEHPIIDHKYDLMKHPNIKLTVDGGAEPYVMPSDYMKFAVTLAAQELETLDLDSIPAELLDKYEFISLEETHE